MDATDSVRTTTPSRVVEMDVAAEPLEAESREMDQSRVNTQGSQSTRQQRETEAQAAPCADVPLELRVEALLMTTDRPLSEARLSEILGIAGKGASKRITAAIESLNQSYTQGSRSFRAERLAGGWQLLTLPAYGPLLHRLHEQRQQTRLSQPALETLAIIAYRQPIMRAEIEAIRGVASGEVLRSLLERRLVKIVGRAEELGRPMLYGVTGEFLKVFGLASADDLPQIKGLNMPQQRPAVGGQQSAGSDQPSPATTVGDTEEEAQTSSRASDADQHSAADRT